MYEALGSNPSTTGGGRLDEILSQEQWYIYYNPIIWEMDSGGTVAFLGCELGYTWN